MESIWQDVKYAARQLRLSPLFTLTAVASLAVGLAGNAAIFSLADTVLLRSRPGITDGDRLVEIGRTQNGRGFDTMSYPNFLDYRDRNAVFDGIAGFRDNQGFGLGSDVGADRVQGTAVSANYFSVLGVTMALGRTFRDDEDRPEAAAPVTILSDGLWRSHFAADPKIVGRTVRLNGRVLTIIGVTPRGFTGHSLAASDLWVPLTLRSTLVNDVPGLLAMREGTWFLALGRLKPDMSLNQAQSQMTRIAQDLERQYPRENRGRGIVLSTWGPLPGAIRSTAAGFIGLLFALVGLITLIACTNIGGMLLARGVLRSREIGVRLAVGAGRARIVRLLVTESLLLGAAGAAAGVGAAFGLVRLLERLMPILPVVLDVDLRIDWRVLGFSAVLAVLVGVVCGLLPAIEAARVDLASTIKTDSTSHGPRPLRLRQAFLVAQIAMSLLLVVTALILARSLATADSIDPGFRVEGVDVAVVDLRLGGYDKNRGLSVASDLLSRAERLPGVLSAASTAVVPLTSNNLGLGRLRVPDQPDDGPGIAVTWNVISPRYFEVLAIPIITGRAFTSADVQGSTDVAIVNQTLARRTWPGRNPIGQLLTQDTVDGKRSLEVVGVARDANYSALAEQPRGFIYVPMAQQYRPTVSLFMRRDAASTIPAMRALVRDVDPNLPLLSAATLSAMTASSLVPHRLASWIAGTAGLIGLLLVTIGVYGITAHDVTRRTREIGIRIALGALRGDVLLMVVRQAMGVAAIGMTVGLAATALGTQLLSGLLYGIEPLDPISFVGGTLALGLLALAASLIPARRAASLNPIEALRIE